MRTEFAIILCLMVAGCAANGAVPNATAPDPVANTVDVLAPVKLSPADIAAVHASVRSSLKDPDSAKFGRAVAGRDKDGIVRVCLHVNAKNSYGGYTGMKPMTGIFAGTPKTFIVSTVPIEHAQFQDKATYDVCGERGLVIPPA